MERPIPQPSTSPTQTRSVLPTIVTEEGAEGVVIRDKSSRTQLTAMLFFAVLWIPLTACFTLMLVLPALASGPRSLAEWTPILFMIPFQLVSLGLIGYVVRWLLIRRKLAPPTLTVRRWPLFLGASSDVIYRRTLRGSSEIRALEAKLVCKEWVRYQSGTDTSTATHVLWQQELPTPVLIPSVEQAEGRWAIQIPPDLPASFAAPNNEVRWSVDVKITATGTPDDTTSFPILVRPEILS